MTEKPELEYHSLPTVNDVFIFPKVICHIPLFQSLVTLCSQGERKIGDFSQRKEFAPFILRAVLCSMENNGVLSIS